MREVEPLNSTSSFRAIPASHLPLRYDSPILADNMDQPVVDRTGLTGVHEFQIDLPLDATTIEMSRRLGRPLNDPAGASESRAAEALGYGWNGAAAQSRC